MKEILKAQRVWHVARGEDAESSFAWDQYGTERIATTTGEVIDDKYAQDVVCSVFFHGPGEILFACVTAHQNDPRRMWEFLHQRYSARTTFSKALLNYTLARTRYTVQAIQEYVARCEQMSVQMASIDALIDEGLFITMFVENFGYRSKSPSETALFALLTREDHIWQLVTSRLLQSFASQQNSRIIGRRGRTSARSSAEQE